MQFELAPEAKTGVLCNSPAIQRGISSKILHRLSRPYRKNLMVMKLTTILLLVAVLQVSARSNAQAITYEAKSVSLEKLFSVIKQQTGFVFFYRQDDLVNTFSVSVSFKNTPLQKALNEILKGQQLSFNIQGRAIFITRVPVHTDGSEEELSLPPVMDMQIKGSVTGKEGKPLAGVSISVKGTSSGASSDNNGNYSISVQKGDILVFSYVGYITQEIEINTQTRIDVQLTEDSKIMNEVMVTALGIKREQRSLTYATQEIKGSDIVDSRETNIVNALQGKFSGVQINNTSGAVSSSSRIQIRGANSLSGNNQPLFVVDGVPIKNSNSTWIGYGGADYGNEIADIDLNDVGSVTILKGANAAALYGSRAANGVILITTKSADNERGGWGLTFTSNTTMQTPAYFLAYQNKYGQGSDGKYSYVDGAGGGVNDDYGGSWGPPLDGRLVDQWFGKQEPWIAHPDNVKDFLNTGWISDLNLSVSKRSDIGSIRFSYGDIRQKGTMPFTDEAKNNIAVNSSVNVSKKITVQLIGNYVRLKNNNIPTSGYTDGNIMSQVIFGGRQIDYNMMKDFENPDGTQKNNYSKYADNPFWLYKYNTNSRLRERLFGSIRLLFDLTPWLNLMLQNGIDTYSENRKEIVNGYTSYASNAGSGGSFKLSEINHSEYNFDAILTVNKDIFPKLNLNANVGANLRNNKDRSVGLTAAELVVPNVFNIANVKGSPSPSNYESESETQSLYGQLTLGYDNFLFVNGTARNDWSSTLPKNNWSYFYPSLGVSFIPSAFINMGDWIDYLKLRANWAQVGNTAAPYQLSQNYVAGIPWNGMAMYQVSNVFPPVNLKPEITTSKEVGLNVQLFKSKLKFDITYYHSNSENQILRLQIPYSSGYSTQVINAGNIRNSGIEIGLSGTPISTNKFSLDLTANWSENRNRILELVDGVSTYQIGGIWGVNSYAKVGGSYGDIIGSSFLRDSEGNIIVDGKGLPKKDPVNKKIGNIMPDWLASFNASLRYKNIYINMLFDIRSGSNTYSLSHRYGSFSGVVAETARGHIREDGIIFKGVTEDGKPNTVSVSPQLLYSTANLTGINEYSTFDGTYIKFRDLSLNYRFTNEILKATRFLKSATLGFSVRNIAILKSNMPRGFDPEVTSGGTDSGLGFEYGYIPTNRSYNLKLQFTF